MPTGPVSQTAAAQGGAAGAPLPTRVPPAVPPAAPGLYAPLAAESVASQAAQAGRLLAAWTLAASRRSLDVQWFSAFWDAVLEEKRGIGLLPGKEALLMSYGFNPNGSCGAPGSGLEAELAQISVRTTATAPAAAASGAVLPGILGSNGGGDSRFDTRLPSSMQRAAPEIYVNLRCQASASVRDWLVLHHPQARNDRRWADLWNAAVAIDFALRDCPNHDEILARLGTDDACELHLRRMASYVYERRTGDARGAEHILAQVAPGTGADIGPDWLICEATLHSRSEYKREELAHAQHGHGRGRGRGRGGGGAAAPGGGGETDPTPGSGDGGPGARGRGGGGGGRGGGRSRGRGGR